MPLVLVEAVTTLKPCPLLKAKAHLVLKGENYGICTHTYER
jgi:hypothetical protein